MFLQLIIAILFLYTLRKVWRRRRCHPDYVNKTVWITGASSGIGQYLAYQFNRRGANLIISARNLTELKRVKQACSHPDLVEVLQLDMSNYDQVEQVTRTTLQKLQANNRKLDVVVENAGISMRCQFRDYHFKNHLNMFDVNVHGPYRHIQCFLDHMIKNKSGQIVAITSVAGKLATTYRSSYAGSKHALIGILDSLRSQLHPYGIKVTNIMPGYVLTNISKNAYGAGDGQKFGATDQNISKGMDPAVFSRQAVQAIYMGEHQLQISGQLLVPLGIFIRNLCPDLFVKMIRHNGKNQSKAVKNKVS